MENKDGTEEMNDGIGCGGKFSPTEKQYETMRKLFIMLGEQIYEEDTWFLMQDQLKYNCRDYYDISENELNEVFSPFHRATMAARAVMNESVILGINRFVDPIDLIRYASIKLLPVLVYIDLGVFINVLFGRTGYNCKIIENSAEVMRKIGDADQAEAYNISTKILREANEKGNFPIAYADLGNNEDERACNLFLACHNHPAIIAEETREAFGNK